MTAIPHQYPDPPRDEHAAQAAQAARIAVIVELVGLLLLCLGVVVAVYGVWQLNTYAGISLTGAAVAVLGARMATGRPLE